MLRGSSRLVLVAALVAGGSAFGLAVAAPATAATGPVVINEVESNGDTPDFIELTNTGTSAVDISGYQLLDDDDDHDPVVVPAGTTLAPGAFAAFDTEPNFGLGDPDAARLFAVDGTTLLDEYEWPVHAITTYGRCPDGTGAFGTTAGATRGTANDCTGVLPPVRTDTVIWPGSPDVSVVDDEGVLGEDQSGLYYEAPGVLWRLVWNGSVWTPDTANGWGQGKQLRYPDGEGEPDSEGVTLVDGDSTNGVFVSTERDNTDDDTSKPVILRFDVSGSDAELVATDEWDMTDDLPEVGPNLGFEALTWVPDDELVADGLRVDPPTAAKAGPLYVPASGDHFGGLFLAGLESNGDVYAYSLDATGTTFERVTSFSSGFPTVMELQWDAEADLLRAVCDNTCTGQQTTLGIRDGAFAVTAAYARPAGLPDVNNEGFAIAPDALCVDGAKPAIWADDDGTDGHALRQGTIDCADDGGTPTSPAPSSGGTTPTVGATGASTPPLAATGADTGSSLALGLLTVGVGGVLLGFGLRRTRGRHAA
jgi:hypothetical protein